MSFTQGIWGRDRNPRPTPKYEVGAACSSEYGICVTKICRNEKTLHLYSNFKQPCDLQHISRPRTSTQDPYNVRL